MLEQTQNFRVFRFILALTLAIGIIGLGVISILRERIVHPSYNQVSFTAEGTVFAKPDIAQLTFGVKTERQQTAVLAVQQNTQKMNKVIAEIKSQGIEDKDIKTTSYNLNPAYDYFPETGRSEIKGYELYQEVSVKVRALDKIGRVIESATEAGANQVGNISFTMDDFSEIKKQARQEAVDKAKQKAEEMTELTGIKLGKLVNVYENDTPYPPVYRNFALDSSEALGMGGGVAPDIQLGENEINVSVTLVYEVK